MLPRAWPDRLYESMARQFDSRGDCRSRAAEVFQGSYLRASGRGLEGVVVEVLQSLWRFCNWWLNQRTQT